MGMLLNEQSYIEDNARQVQDTMSSPLNRYTDKKVFFVKYFHINPDASSVDLGFENIERVLGPNSPLRFNQIDNFPLMDLDPMVFNLGDEEQGFDISFDSEAISFPEVLEPYANDIFVITHIGTDYVFMVTGFEHDSIKSHNYYKISYTLKDIGSYSDLEKQVVERYQCIYSNIGTEQKCIVRNEEYDSLIKFDKIYTSISDAYRLYFYSDKFNSFIYSIGHIYQVYDAFLNEFITSNKLFHKKNDLEVLYTMNEDIDKDFEFSYDRSFYNAIERRKMKWYQKRYYELTPIKDPMSLFSYYRQKNVMSVKLQNDGMNDYIPSQLVYYLDKFQEMDADNLDEFLKSNPLYQLVVRYFYDDTLDAFNIGIKEIEETDYDMIDKEDYEQFILIPILLFIMKKLYDKSMLKQNV